MYVNYLVKKEEKDYYGLKLFMGLFFLVLILAYTSLYAIQNYYSDSIFSFSQSSKKIYVLKSDTLNMMYDKKDMDYDAYQKRVEYLESLADRFGYDTADVKSTKLKLLEHGSILLVIDMMSLSSSEINDIDLFVKKGGKILFNFTSGFLNPSLTYQRKNLVSKIAKLQLSKQHNTIKFKKKNSMFMSTRLLSPVTQYLPEGYGLSMSLYDALPIFHTNKKADAYLTNWAQSHYAQIGKNKELPADESGLVWHGTRGEGKWVYFSFPSYVFTESGEESYKKLFHGMLSYLDKKINIQLYPYLDVKNAVFISEDTEYKYESLSQFQKVAKKYKFPVTAFCVANLALKHKSLMHNVGKNSLIDVGSHSYSHKKIVGESDEVYERETIGSKDVLNKFTKEELIGFRAPREELDSKMIALLKEANYKYILDAADNRIYPYFKNGMLMISKHGTDDYSFLINLDWSSKQILHEMKKEVNVVINLDGIYSLSTHTHLMIFRSNVKIIDSFMKYVKRQKNMTPLNGRMICDRVSKRINISTKSVITEKKMILTVSNDNAKIVENVHYEIVVDPSVHITHVESEIIGLKTTLVKKNNGKYVLIIKSLKPKSQIVLFVKYVQNS